MLVDHDHGDNKPVWPTWAVGALFRGVRRVQINHVCENVCEYIGCVGPVIDRLLNHGNM
jgi:hypothetical protein